MSDIHEQLPNNISEIVKKHYPDMSLNKECLKEIYELLLRMFPRVRSGRASP